MRITLSRSAASGHGRFFDGDGPFQANGLMTSAACITRGANAQSQLPMADFMLGLPAVFSQGGSQIVPRSRIYVGAYVQDVWRMSVGT